MKAILLITMSWFCLTAGFSGAVDLTSAQAEQMALNHSWDLKKARAESEAYQADLKAARAGRFPNITADATALHNSDISQLDMEILGNRIQRDIGLHENYQTNVKISLPLYTGGKISSSIDLAQANLAIRNALEQKSSDDIRYLARQSCLELARADELVDAARSSLTRTELLRQDVQSMYDAGTADSVDLYEAELAVNNASLAVDQAASGRRSREIVLSMLLGLEPEVSIRLTEAYPAPSEVPEEQVVLNDNKAELVGARSAIELNRSIIRLNKASYMPDLAVFAGYAYGKPNLSPFEKDFNGNATVGATLNWSFNLGGRTGAQVRAARQRLEASRHEYDRVHEALLQQARIAYESLKLAYTGYRTAETSYRIAADNYRLAKVKNREGVLSPNHLLDTEAALSQAEAMLASSEADYRLALNQYEYLVGKHVQAKGE
ncbi:MAG TPA: TolC family protein [candidate division Zixibacteria bacterium]|nr:TolC family protein [candidate division Zixibacteria bacterium]